MMKNKTSIMVVSITITYATVISSVNSYNYFSNSPEHVANITKTKIIPSDLKVLVSSYNDTGSSFGESKPYSDTLKQQQALPDLFNRVQNSVVQITSKVPLPTNIIINGNPLE